MLRSSSTEHERLTDVVAQEAKQQLLKRLDFIQAAVKLLARLKLAQQNQSSRSVAPVFSRSAELKVAMAYLLNEDALQGLLDELEAALEASKETMAPDAYRQASLVYKGAAELLEQEVIPVLGQRM